MLQRWSRCCARTLGVIVYQEQVIADSPATVAGYSLARRPAAARDGQERSRRDGQAARAIYVRCGRRTRYKEKAGDLFDLNGRSSGNMAFNKSHSAAYALLAYHTAMLKTHYPVDFMARC